MTILKMMMIIECINIFKSVYYRYKILCYYADYVAMSVLF